MQKQTLIQKSLHSLAFTLRHGCNGFCVPSKAVATAKPRRQKALWKRVGRLEFGTRLDVEEVTVGKRIRLVLSHEGDDLGEVQLKWLPVIRPLLPWGTGIRVVRITGHENEHYRLGLNICFTHLTSSIEALQRALGTDIGREGYGSDRAAHTAAGGDGYSDDEADCLPLEAEPVKASTLANQAGDGATAPVELDGKRSSEEIRFWRDERGVLRLNIPHVQKHSPSGPEVGYRGSGPADAALSVLCAVTSRAEAGRYYQLYKDEVIANMSASGGSIARSDVERWLSSMRSE